MTTEPLAAGEALELILGSIQGAGEGKGTVALSSPLGAS